MVYKFVSQTPGTLQRPKPCWRTRVWPYRWRSSSVSSSSATASSSAAKLPAMKATNLAACAGPGDGNCERYVSAALWLAFSLRKCLG